MPLLATPGKGFASGFAALAWEMGRSGLSAAASNTFSREEVKHMRDTPVKVLPIGRPAGVVAAPSNTELVHTLRRGGKSVRVARQMFDVWVLALAGGSESGPVTDRLVKANLLLPWTETAEDYKHYAALRVIPCGMGGANLPEKPDAFPLLSPRDGSAVLYVDLLGFALYGSFDGAISLEDVCVATAERLAFPLDQVRQRAALLLPALVRSGLAFIDLAVR